MLITKAKPVFTPVTIALETPEDVEVFKNILSIVSLHAFVTSDQAKALMSHFGVSYRTSSRT